MVSLGTREASHRISFERPCLVMVFIQFTKEGIVYHPTKPHEGELARDVYASIPNPKDVE